MDLATHRTMDMDTFPLSSIRTELDEIPMPDQADFPSDVEKMPVGVVTIPEGLSAQDEAVIQSNQQAGNTCQWLMENYEAAPGYSLPRCLIYEHYSDFCQRKTLRPINAASFGKMIRQVFPELKTRRLGTRGQSKYHYYGIKVRQDSPYYNTLYGSQRMSLPCPAGGPGQIRSFIPFAPAPTLPLSTAGEREGGGGERGKGAGATGGGVEGKGEGELQGPSSSSLTVDGGRFSAIENTSDTSLGKDLSIEKEMDITAAEQTDEPVRPLIQPPENPLLPAFPSAHDLVNLPSTIDKAQVNDLLRDYRIHSAIILEVILRSGLLEVDYYIQNYWSSMPLVHQRLVQNARVCEALAVCDTFLYHTIVSVLIPGTLNPFPPSLLQGIRQFSGRFPRIVKTAIASCPKQVAQNKMPVVKRFSQLMKRKTSLAHLSQASRSALAANVTINQMRLDWERRTEHDTVCSQLVWTMPELRGVSQQEIRKQMNRFQALLESRATVEEHIKWVEDVRSFFVDKEFPRDSQKYQDAERAFLIAWNYVCGLIIRDQTLRSATSFGSFHLLNLLYEEYLLYAIEVHRYQREEMSLWRRVMGEGEEMPDGFLLTDIDLDNDDCDDLQDLLSSPTKSNSSHDDILDADIAQGLQIDLGGDLQTVDSKAYRDLLEPTPTVRQSDIIPLAFAASAGSQAGDDDDPPVSAPNAPKDFDVTSYAMTSGPSVVSSVAPPPLTAGQFKLASCTTTSATKVPLTTPGQAPTFVTSKLVRATLITPAVGKCRDAQPTVEKASSARSTSEEATTPPVLTLNVPAMPGLDLHKGQFLTAGDGKKYVINEVQTVLQSASAKPQNG